MIIKSLQGTRATQLKFSLYIRTRCRLLQALLYLFTHTAVSTYTHCCLYIHTLIWAEVLTTDYLILLSASDNFLVS